MSDKFVFLPFFVVFLCWHSLCCFLFRFVSSRVFFFFRRASGVAGLKKDGGKSSGYVLSLSFTCFFFFRVFSPCGAFALFLLFFLLLLFVVDCYLLLVLRRKQAPGMPRPDCFNLGLLPLLSGPEEYHFVNQGDCYDLRKVEDEDEFVLTKAALEVSMYLALTGGLFTAYRSDPKYKDRLG